MNDSTKAAIDCCAWIGCLTLQHNTIMRYAKRCMRKGLIASYDDMLTYISELYSLHSHFPELLEGDVNKKEVMLHISDMASNQYRTLRIEYDLTRRTQD